VIFLHSSGTDEELSEDVEKALKAIEVRNKPKAKKKDAKDASASEEDCMDSSSVLIVFSFIFSDSF
jgi:hypothetical protein